MGKSNNPIKKLDRNNDMFITIYILSFMIVMFLFFHKKEAWEGFILIEEYMEHHIFLVFLTLSFSIIYYYRKKLLKKIEAKKAKVVNHYKLRLIKQKAPQVSFNIDSDDCFFYIQKESLVFLKFPSEEVLEDDKLIFKRKYDLLYATLLGNRFKHKAKIYFKDDSSYKCVETTIWQHDDHFISLKGGKTMPINRITKIKY